MSAWHRAAAINGAQLATGTLSPHLIAQHRRSQALKRHSQLVSPPSLRLQQKRSQGALCAHRGTCEASDGRLLRRAGQLPATPVARKNMFCFSDRHDARSIPPHTHSAAHLCCSLSAAPSQLLVWFAGRPSGQCACRHVGRHTDALTCALFACRPQRCPSSLKAVGSTAPHRTCALRAP